MRAELIERVRRGERVEYLFFWGHRPEPDGSAGRGCLSQWWPARFVADGREFATAEHYMMWRKALLFDDAAVAEEVLRAPHPGRAKELGRQVAGFEPARWEVSRYDIVVAGSVAKFGQNPELGRFLVGTGSQVLVEASPVDAIWGIGVAADDPCAGEPERWPGLNLLGFALMDARARLAG
ncbi:NADAR family protein [Amycolatopsis thermoflava]|uniref:NADAR family protein n=1 Tax=Amycolatopsis thermoflava TaxID=84480 RepID=UPI003646EE60